MDKDELGARERLARDRQPPELGKAVVADGVRMVLKASVVNLAVKKPAGKWKKVSGQIYQEIQPAPDRGLPVGLGLNTIPGFTMLMRENRDRLVFARITEAPKS